MRVYATLSLAVIITFMACGVVFNYSDPVEPVKVTRRATMEHYDTAITAAVKYYNRVPCGQLEQPNTPKVCAEDEVMELLELSSETSFLGVQIAKGIVFDPNASMKTKRAAAAYAREITAAFKRLVAETE